MKGVVVKSTGSWYEVRLPDAEVVRCRIKGRFRLDGHRLTNPVAVGDEVLIDREPGLDTAIIKEILPRRNYVVRQSPRRKHFMHLIACNIDQAFLIVSIRSPRLKPGFIDRFLLTTESHNIPTFLIFNKADLYGEAGVALYEELADIYRELGYESLLVSAQTGQNVDQLRELMARKTTLISGHSGVGKSTLANQIQADLDLRTQAISESSGKGMHTTTFAEMYSLDNGGYLIDTPGIKELGFINMEPVDIGHNFKEIFDFSQGCKFNNCLHVNEPQCAVQEAVQEGYISEWRYQNYLNILEEVQAQNAWERNTDW